MYIYALLSIRYFLPNPNFLDFFNSFLNDAQHWTFIHNG